jgi:hypothetical protein
MMAYGLRGPSALVIGGSRRMPGRSLSEIQLRTFDSDILAKSYGRTVSIIWHRSRNGLEGR